MGFLRRHVLTIAALATAAAGLAAGIFDTSAVVDKGADTYLTWAETRGVPTWVSSVVKVLNHYDEERGGRAAGVILKTVYVKSQKQWHTYILTAAHVVAQKSQGVPGQAEATDCDGDDPMDLISPNIFILGEQAEVLKWDTDVDLALVTIVTPHHPRLWLQERSVNVEPVILSTQTPKPAEEVWTVGFPGDIRLITRGYVGEANGSDLTHSAAAMPGNSGGGLFHDGKLIGINVAVRCDPTVGQEIVPVFAVGGEAILEFLGGEYSDLAKTDSITQWALRLWR
jgi:Trypsin-like peptidase domain